MSLNIDGQLRRLGELRKAQVSDGLRDEIRKALAAKSNFVVARAADIAKEKGLRELVPELASAFARQIDSPERDKGCEAKLALIKALHELDYDDAELFIKGIRHVQMEASFGGKVDSAAGLRAASAIGLARLRYGRVLVELLPLLVDPAAQVRAAAAEAIAATGRSEGELLLRMKVLSGDREPEVMAACFSSLLQLARESALEFVAGYLASAQESFRDAAALALGTSRLPQAFEILKGQWSAGLDERFMDVLLLALASMRDERAMAFMLSLIQEGSHRAALAVLRALKPFATDERIRNQLEAAISKRGDTDLRKEFDRR